MEDTSADSRQDSENVRHHRPIIGSGIALSYAPFAVPLHSLSEEEQKARIAYHAERVAREEAELVRQQKETKERSKAIEDSGIERSKWKRNLRVKTRTENRRRLESQDCVDRLEMLSLIGREKINTLRSLSLRMGYGGKRMNRLLNSPMFRRKPEQKIKAGCPILWELTEEGWEMLAGHVSRVQDRSGEAI